jgi:hypothetical protein
MCVVFKSKFFCQVCRSRREKEDDVRYLLPVLRALKPREVLQDAPRFLAQPKAVLLEFVNRAMATSFFAEKPSELLLRFHTSTAQETRCADEVRHWLCVVVVCSDKQDD